MRWSAFWLAAAASGVAEAFTFLCWNTGGNGATDWSTNAPQVQAIGRILSHLRPDVISLQEIPFPHTGQLTNWLRAWLSGYQLATNSGTDGYLRSAVFSRHPIRRSTKWLDGARLEAWGYAGTFTRDLFEVELSIPGWAEPVHVFTVHFKSGSREEDLRRRSAEAAAVSNHLVTVFLPAHPGRPYLLAGDLNEDVLAPPAGSLKPVGRLVNPATGLRLLSPRAPGSTSEKTWSTRGPGLWYRYDYVLPGGLLFSNVVRAEVFRTATLQPLPPQLNRDDEVVASDHLPLWVEFGLPAPPPFRIVRVLHEPGRLTLAWEAHPTRVYALEVSEDTRAWQPVAEGLSTTAEVLTHTFEWVRSPALFRVRREP